MGLSLSEYRAMMLLLNPRQSSTRIRI